MILKTFKTISIIRRRIKDNYCYDDFRKNWLPEIKEHYSIPTYVITALKVQDKKEVISIGLIAADFDAVIEEAKRTMSSDFTRRDKIIEVANAHGNAELYEIQDIDNLSSRNFNCHIKVLSESDILVIIEAFKAASWNKPESLF